MESRERDRFIKLLVISWVQFTRTWDFGLECHHLNDAGHSEHLLMSKTDENVK